MTNEDALNHICDIQSVLEYHTADKYQIKACDVAITALEKQIPKSPKDKRGFKAAGDFDGYLIGLCPSCKAEICHEYKYCCICGQALDWEVK